jgi:hemolysin activation/secretion protein
VHPLSLTYSALTRAAAAELSFTGSFLANLPGGKDGRQSDFDASRADATARYRLVRGGMNFLAQVAADWQARVGVAGQYTKKALVSGEQYGLGGADTVRGYQLREMASDRGTSAQFELYTPDLANLMKLAGEQKLRFLAFFDTGRISRNHALPGELTHQSIRSAGGGLRWNYAKNASLRVDMAKILVGTSVREEGSWHGLATLVLSY